MTTDRDDDTDDSSESEGGEGKSRWATGDDERETREHIAETGEPQRDALGNASGAS
jgi:hypothetical protein